MIIAVHEHSCASGNGRHRYLLICLCGTRLPIMHCQIRYLGFENNLFHRLIGNLYGRRLHACITSERVPLGRGSVVGALVCLKCSCHFKKARDSETGCFQGYLFSRRDQNPRKPQKFCPSKISSYTVVINL